MFLLKITKITAFVAVVLSLVISFCACGKSDDPTSPAVPSESTVTEETAETEAKTANITVLVRDKEGKTTEFRIQTSKTNLADALTEKALVEGENTDKGLYITVVNGIRADYEEDNAYWAICDKDGNLLPTGASSTAVSDGDVFMLVYTAV